MRRWGAAALGRWVILAQVGLSAGCATHASDYRGAPTNSAASRDVSRITVQRRPGGWGDGPSYTITLERDGSARFEGAQGAPRKGRYTATLSASAFDSIVTYLLAQPFLNSAQPSTDYHALNRQSHCVDAPTASVIMIVRHQTRILVDDCQDTVFLARYITPVETLSERLAWQAR